MKPPFGPSQAVKATKLTLYIPNKDKQGNYIESISHWVGEAQSMLTVLFGGCTCILSKGMWYNPTNDTFIEENTAMVMTYVNIEDLQNHVETLYRFMQNFLSITNQDAVALEYDGYMYFISAATETEKAVA